MTCIATTIRHRKLCILFVALSLIQSWVCVDSYMRPNKLSFRAHANGAVLISVTAILLWHSIATCIASLKRRPYDVKSLLIIITVGFLVFESCIVQTIIYQSYAPNRYLMYSTTPIVTTGLIAMIVCVYASDRLQSISSETEKLAITHNARLKKHVIFIEGTSGLGKTTISKMSFDYTWYLGLHPIYATKGDQPHVQILYDWHILLDIIIEMQDMIKNIGADYVETRNPVLLDRSFVSQIVYSLLFQHRGHIVEPKTFERSIDPVFSDREFAITIRHVVLRWFSMLQQMLGPEYTVGIQWFIAKDPAYTKRVMLERNGADVRTDNINLEHYIENQNYLFKKMHAVLGLGVLTGVRHIGEGDISIRGSRSSSLKSVTFLV